MSRINLVHSRALNGTGEQSLQDGEHIPSSSVLLYFSWSALSYRGRHGSTETICLNKEKLDRGSLTVDLQDTKHMRAHDDEGKESVKVNL